MGVPLFEATEPPGRQRTMSEHESLDGTNGCTVPPASSNAFPTSGGASAKPALSPTHASEIAFALFDRIARNWILRNRASKAGKVIARANINASIAALRILPGWARHGLWRHLAGFARAEATAPEYAVRVVVSLTDKAAQFLAEFCRRFRVRPDEVIATIAGECANQSEAMAGSPLALHAFHQNLADTVLEKRAARQPKEVAA